MIGESHSLTLSSNKRLSIRFSSDAYGVVGFENELQSDLGFVLTKNGFALKLTEKAKIKSYDKNFSHWYKFKAETLGTWANIAEPENDWICDAASKNPDMILHSLSEIEAEHSHRHDFKRAKRPLIRFLHHEDPCLGILWEYYPALGRIGIYIGRDEKGFGGCVKFFDTDKNSFRFL